MNPLVDFFTENTPPLRIILTAGPVGLAWAMGCLAMISLAVVLDPDWTFMPSHAWRITVIAGACALAEAVSPHGIDNLVLMVGSSWLAAIML